MSAVDPRLVAAMAEQLRRRGPGKAAPELERLIDEARRVLEAAGERLQPGDRVITGNVVQVTVELGERVEADVAPLGSAWLQLR